MISNVVVSKTTFVEIWTFGDLLISFWSTSVWTSIFFRWIVFVKTTVFGKWSVSGILTFLERPTWSENKKSFF